jgi:hypothetical protein
MAGVVLIAMFRWHEGHQVTIAAWLHLHLQSQIGAANRIPKDPWYGAVIVNRWSVTALLDDLELQFQLIHYFLFIECH